MRKGIKTTLITIGSITTVLGLTLGTTATFNAVAGADEATRIQDYGQKVSTSHGKVNVVDRGKGERTIVLLPGFGTAAPALDFEPLMDTLAVHSRVIAYEPLGYGLSDRTEAPRTSANYSRELHETLQQLGVQNPVLMGHSISGVYALQYVHDYPGQIAGFIGIDHSVPGQAKVDQVPPVKELRLLKDLGLMRVLTGLSADPYEGTPFTASAREQMSMLSNRNSMNDVSLDEARHMPENFERGKSQAFPAELPLLYFVAQDGELDGWEELHRQQLSQSRDGEMLVLDGSHYLHHTHWAEIAEKTEQFLAGSARS